MEAHHRFSVTVNPATPRGELSVLFSGEGEPVAGHFIGPAVHDYYLLHMVMSGRGSFETMGERHELGEGDAFIIFPHILTRYEASRAEPWSYRWVAFTGAHAEEMLASIGITPRRAVVRQCLPSDIAADMESLRQALEAGESPALGHMKASGCLQLVLHQLGRNVWHGGAAEANGSTMEGAKREERSPAFRQIEQAIRLLSMQYGRDLSIQSIADTLGYHRAHLTKLFKSATGLSPMQYLHKIRMKKAEELLGGSLSIAQIAASVGYADPLFFTRQFRRWRGVSPTEFRRNGAPDA